MNALFDLDGTLCDPSVGILKGFEHSFREVGLPYPGAARATAQIGRPLLDCFQALGCGGRSAEAAAHFQAFFAGRGFAEARLYDGVLDCLQALRSGGWGLAVASSKPTFAVRFVAEALGLLGRLEGFYGCAPDDLRPDKSAIVAGALAGLGWKAAGTVFIGDRDQDREAAKAHGMDFVAAAWGFGGPGEHAGAAAVAASPRELASVLGRLVR